MWVTYHLLERNPTFLLFRLVIDDTTVGELQTLTIRYLWIFVIDDVHGIGDPNLNDGFDTSTRRDLEVLDPLPSVFTGTEVLDPLQRVFV